jgi:hypothetical protein
MYGGLGVLGTTSRDLHSLYGEGSLSRVLDEYSIILYNTFVRVDKDYFKTLKDHLKTL